MAENLSFLDYNMSAKGKTNPVKLSIPGEPERQWLLNVPREKVLCLDLETTGLYPHNTDEILQIAICDGNGEEVLSTYVHPAKRKRWPKAQEVNGITWQMVKDAPTMKDLEMQIFHLLYDCELLIGYNIRGFDLKFLKAAGVIVPSKTKVYDVMLDCSVLYGRWNNKYRNYTFVKLKSMADHFGISYAAHDALEDAITTTKVFYALLESTRLKNAVNKSVISKSVIDKAVVNETITKKTIDKKTITNKSVEKKATNERDEYGFTDEQYKLIGCLVLVLGFVLLLLLFFIIF